MNRVVIVPFLDNDRLETRFYETSDGVEVKTYEDGAPVSALSFTVPLVFAILEAATGLDYMEQIIQSSKKRIGKVDDYSFIRCLL